MSKQNPTSGPTDGAPSSPAFPPSTTPADATVAPLPGDSLIGGGPKRRRDIIAQALFPGVEASPAGQRFRVARWSALAVVAAFLLAWGGSYGLDYLSATPTTRYEKEIADALDREGPAFTATVRENSEPRDRIAILDEILTPEERRELLGANQREDGGYKKFLSILKRHNTKELDYFSALRDGYSKSWFIDLYSDRSAGFSIVDMRIRDLKCTPASAKAVFLFPPEGAADRHGMLFEDISESTNPAPIISDIDDPHFGEPFFSHKKIDLGNGATPGGLSVTVSSGHNDCSWTFEAEYGDTQGRHTQEIKNGKENFSVKGVPAHPDQLFILTPESPYFIDCRARNLDSSSKEKCGDR